VFQRQHDVGKGRSDALQLAHIFSRLYGR